MNKKITSSALAALMIAGTTSFTAFASMAKGTVVIGDKAFDLNYANDPKNADEITNLLVKGGAVYFKDFDGNWIDNLTNDKVLASVIPAVTYKSATGVETKFDAKDMDAVTTLAVASVSAINNTRVDVELTTAVTTVDKASFIIKDASGTAIAVNSATLSADGKSVKVITAAQTANMLYTMTVSGSDYKFVGVPVDTVKPTLTSAVATKNTKVKLVFSKNVDVNALNIANYSIAGLSVLNAEYDVDVNGDAVKTDIILTTAAQAQGTIYKVVVSNVADMSGNAIDTTLTTNAFQFGGLAIDTTKPVVSSAVALTNATVKVQFSKTMDKVSAENIANYSIAGLNVLKATISADMTYVTLNTVAQVQGTIYKVVVSNVKDDSANVIDSTLTTSSFQFGGLAVDTVKPTLTSAVALSNTTVKVQLSKIVDATTAQNAGNYTIAGLTVTKAVLSTSKTYVTLTTSAQTQGTIYKVVVANVADASGNVIDSTLTTNAFQFGGLALDAAKPTVTVASSMGNKTVKVIFSEPVDTTTATKTYNYYLGTSLGYPSSVIMDSTDTTGKTVILTTAAQTAAIYTVAVSGIADLSGNIIDSTLTSSKATFGGTAAVADTVKPTVTSAVALDNNTVAVTFSKPMASAAAKTAANYVFTVQTGTETGTTIASAVNPTKVILSEDGKTATMGFATATMTSGVVYKVTVNGLADTVATPNVIDTTANFSLFAGITNVNPAPKVATAQVVNNSTLKVTFTEALTVTGGLVGTDFALTTVSGTAFTPATFSSAVMSEDNKSVTVYYNAATFTGGSIYSVRVAPGKFTDELDIATLSSAVISGTTQANDAMFAGISVASTTPKISAAIAVDVNTIDVTFDQEVTSTLGAGDVTVAGATVVKVRTEGTAGNKVRVFFTGTPFTVGNVYTVNVDQTKVKNMNNTAMIAADNNAIFAAISTVNPKPSIAAVTVVNATTIKVVMSEKVDATLATNGNVDFAIAGKVISAPSLALDGKTITLTLDTALTAGINTITVAGTADIKDEASVDIMDATSTLKFVY